MGWRLLYDVAVKERWFEATGKTPFEAVFYSNFEDFVDKISLRNARG